MQDPTERLALALGLQPRQLAVYTGKLTTESMGSVNALRYALAHPLVLVGGCGKGIGFSSDGSGAAAMGTTC